MTPRVVGLALVVVVLSVCATGARHVNKERHLTPGRHANESPKVEPQRVADYRGSDMPRHKAGPRLVSAPSDSFVLGAFSFDAFGVADAQGWYSVDRTAQTEIFTHVADSTELTGGFFGSLVSIAGQQSLWCGTAGNTFGTCYYAAPPGYGNGWAARAYTGRWVPRAAGTALRRSLGRHESVRRPGLERYLLLPVERAALLRHTQNGAPQIEPRSHYSATRKMVLLK